MGESRRTLQCHVRSCFLMLNNFNLSSDERTRQLYVAMTMGSMG